MEQKTDCSDTAQRQLEQALGAPHNPKNQVSGGPIEDFREGWAKMPFTGERAHYFLIESAAAIGSSGRQRWYKALCGVVAQVGRTMPFHPGSYQKCKRCLNKSSKL